jgi:hypothetical protein
MALRLGDAVRVALGGSTAHRRERLYVQSVETISDCISALVVATLFLLTAILVRSVVTPEMDGKITADGTALELRKSLP